jgi:DNA-binding CsgD family transcriptional regulator
VTTLTHERLLPRADRDTRLVLARVVPVIDQLAGDLAGTDVGVVLTDASDNVVARRMPGSSVGEMFEAPHFDAVALTSHGLVSASAPFRDPRHGEHVGTLTLVCPAESASALLLPLARRAAHDCTQRLLDGCSARERLLDEQFLQAHRRSRAPLIVVGERTLRANAAAAAITTPLDRKRLWHAARHAVEQGRSELDVVVGDNARAVTAAVVAVRDGEDLAGVVLRLRRVEATHTATAVSRPPLGWESLSAAERSLASIVGQGLTNREAAARLFVSPHTVDSHLRHIFRKLDINSRVELAALVARQHDDQRVSA